MVEIVVLTFAVGFVIMMFVVNKKMDDKCQPCTFQHQLVLVSSSNDFDYYECANPKCNHSKHHRK